jgi:hypothetical protein
MRKKHKKEKLLVYSGGASASLIAISSAFAALCLMCFFSLAQQTENLPQKTWRRSPKRKLQNSDRWK